MSKFFYRGRPDVMSNYGKAGYAPKPNVKLGSANNPLSLIVQSEERQLQIEAILLEHQLIANINIEASQPENITELDAVLNKPITQVIAKTPQRNEPCICGSTKKYKKCCGK